MNSTQILFLGSKSASRQMLLNEASIPFQLVHQNVDETQCDWSQPLPTLVTAIARYKMEHLQLPVGKEGHYSFVLTADTLSQDPHGVTHGKPIDRADAIAKIKAARGGFNTCATAFCLEKRMWTNDGWIMQQRKEICVQAKYIFEVPDAWIDDYLEKSFGLTAAGAIAIEKYGSLFLKEIQGSYTTIVGLPIFELRTALTDLGFFGRVQ